MGLIPRLEIQGGTGALPRFWPMHIGSARPSSIDACRGPASRTELSWDAAGRLLEVRLSFGTEPVQMREVYRWRGDELEGIRYFDGKDADVFGEMATERPVGEMLIAARPVKRTRGPRRREASVAAPEPESESE